MTRYRHDYVLEQTCHAWPERYDVILSGEVIGAIRFRSGVIEAEYDYNNVSDEVYRAEADEDIELGLMDAAVRNHHLNEAVAAIDNRHFNPKTKPLPRMNAKPIGWTMIALDDK